MLHEEAAQGGSARHLWVQYNLPQNPGECCKVAGGGQLCTCLQPICCRAVLADAASPHVDLFTTLALTRTAARCAEIYCYVSPILHQIRCSTSKIEMEQWIGAKGGAGWIALQVGAGARCYGALAQHS